MSISFINRKSGGGGGDGSSLNLFVQQLEPAIKKGIWLQAEREIEHICYDEEIFIGGEWLADGIKPSIPYEFYCGDAVVIGTDIYLLGGYRWLSKKL